MDSKQASVCVWSRFLAARLRDIRADGVELSRADVAYHVPMWKAEWSAGVRALADARGYVPLPVARSYMAHVQGRASVRDLRGAENAEDIGRAALAPRFSKPTG